MSFSLSSGFLIEPMTDISLNYSCLSPVICLFCFQIYCLPFYVLEGAPLLWFPCTLPLGDIRLIGNTNERLEIRRKGGNKVFLSSLCFEQQSCLSFVSSVALAAIAFPPMAPLALGLGFEASVTPISPFLLVIVAAALLTSGFVTILYLPSVSFHIQCSDLLY